MTTFAMSAHAQLNQQGQSELTSPLEPLRPGVTAVHIFDELLVHNAPSRRDAVELYRIQDL
jgi:hypothetical protein